MKLIPLVMPEKNPDMLEKLWEENQMFAEAAFSSLLEYGNFWPSPYDEIFFSNMQGVINSGFFEVKVEELGQEIDVSVKVWNFGGGGYRGILDITDADSALVTRFHEYFLNTN